MKIVKMKIRAYDEPSRSLLVSFASDSTSSSNPEDYEPVAFQPLSMWPDVIDPVELCKRIAVSGMWNVEQQEKNEALDKDPSKLDGIKSMVGMEASYAVEDLITPPEIDVPSVEV